MPAVRIVDVAPDLSVVLPTTKPWPELRACLDALGRQTTMATVEVLVCDGDGHALPNDGPPPSRHLVRAVSLLGGSVFDLRAKGLIEAKGRVVAITEDHCVPTPDWCERILAAHDAHPDAAAVVGSVVNGSETQIIDQANYLMTFAAWIPPIDEQLRHHPPSISNSSYKREALPRDSVEPGWLELTFNHRLAREGGISVDDAVRVVHVQSHGFFGTFAVHFHNGRSTAGFAVRDQPFVVKRRHLRDLVHRPSRIYRETRTGVQAKQPDIPARRRTLALVAVLACCHAVGEATGYLAGPGRSPVRLV